MPDEEKKKKKRFWSKRRAAIFALLLIGIAFGALMMHYLVEPVIGESVTGQLAVCMSQKNVLNERWAACEVNLQDLNRLCSATCT